MNAKIKKSNQQYLPVLLVICGGPIGKGNNKTIIQANSTTPINKKQTKENLEEEKKSSHLIKTK
ncbi:MAG: hypothetical protein LBF27_15515 [Sphingobacterium sp.]|jgi:hypothetical protein|nr:hypothetical protein [Sphingobacterium sp.]